MTKQTKHLLIGAVVVAGAIYLYRQSKPKASTEETSSFLGFGRSRASKLRGASNNCLCRNNEGGFTHQPCPCGSPVNTPASK